MIAIGYIIGIIFGLYFKTSIAFLIVVAYIILKFTIAKKTLYKIFKKFFIIFSISALIGNTYVLIEKARYNKIYKIAQSLESISGVVISDKEEKDYSNKYIIKSTTKGLKNSKFIIYINKINEELKYGDKIRFKGKYIEPEGRRNYRGFNYKEYLKTKKLYGTFKISGNIEVINHGTPLNLFYLTSRLRQKIIKNVEKILPKEEASILLGILLGEKNGITEENRENFKLSSMSHILAVSGMHTTYLIWGLTYILGKFPKKSKYIFLIIFLIFFMFLTNFTPSVVRAVIMSIMMIASKLLHKKNDVINSLFLSLLILLLYNPYLIKNIGLLLSFMGTLGIILFYKKIRLKIGGEDKSKVYDILSLSISVQILVFPLTIFYFNIFSLSFLISGFICTFLVGAIFIYGFINITVSIISIKIASKISIFLKLMLKLLSFSAGFIANIKFLNFTVITPHTITIIVYYLAIFLITYIINIKNKPKEHLRRYEKKAIQYLSTIDKKKCVAIILIFVVVISSYKPIYYAVNKDLVLHFIDVGQGDGMLIISPKGKTILIDTGEDKELALSYLLDRGISKLNYVIISHFDVDHVGGLCTIIDRIRVENVIIAKQFQDSENFQKFLKSVKHKDTKVNVVKAGDRLNVEENLYIDILWPGTQDMINDNSLNNNSLVCRLNHQDFSLLLTGDIEEVAEKAILAKYQNTNILNSTILKVAHHGSSTSSNEEFIEAVNPQIALIGVGKDNKFGHPDRKIIERLKKGRINIFRTDENGEITLRQKGQALVCLSERKTQLDPSRQQVLWSSLPQ